MNRPVPHAILAAALVPLAAPAMAEMPRYDVTAYCKELAGFGGTYSETMYAGCFEMEQDAYNKLKPRWNGFPGAMRRYCDEIARLGSAGSYAMLEGCVVMELEAASTDKIFEY